MAKYNVFVPARKDSDMPDLSLTVDASNWLVALKESLRQIGEQGDSLANIVCETAPDGSLRVADPASKRVFIIRQGAAQGEDQMAAEAERRAAESRRLAEAAEKAKQETEARLRDVENRMGPPSQVIKAAQVAEAAKAAASAEEARKLEEEKARLQRELVEAKAKLAAAASKAHADSTGILGEVKIETHKKDARKVEGAEWDDLDDWYDTDYEEDIADSAISDIFLATDNLHQKSETEQAQFVLSLANRYVQAEAASVFFSDTNSALQDLIIAAASGPVAKKIIGVRVPLGKGIVGFSVQNGVKLIVNQVQHNPNFYGKLDQEFGFRTYSILCVPVQNEDRTYGAIELINKKGEFSQWTASDANILQSLGALLGKAVETRIMAAKE